MWPSRKGSNLIVPNVPGCIQHQCEEQSINLHHCVEMKRDHGHHSNKEEYFVCSFIKLLGNKSPLKRTRKIISAM